MHTTNEPLEDVRTEVVKVNTYFVGNEVFFQDEKTGLAVRLSQNLDNYTDEDGNTQYLRDGEAPRAGIIEHRGITRLKAGEYAGQYVIIQEILKEGEKRRKSLRRAILVTDEQALDYIIFANRLDILERPRFFPLKALYFRSAEPIDFRSVKAPEEVEQHFREVKE